jgi:xyloglucan-specific endo-beta-1,4-glucanase
MARSILLTALVTAVLTSACPVDIHEHAHSHTHPTTKVSIAAAATTVAEAATQSTTKASIVTAATTVAEAATQSTTEASIVTTATTAAEVATQSATKVSTVAAALTDTEAATNLCGTASYLILQDTPWIVDNMVYNSGYLLSTDVQCTGYLGQTTTTNSQAALSWNSTTAIEYVESNDNVPKGYSFIGLTENLENKISAISSIPASYTWTRTNTTAFKGNVCFDFMTNDVAGDSTSSDSHELMLWLQYEGGQLPIGWTSGAVATIDSLFGTSWKLYEGVNDSTGITVSSLLPDTQFEGTFEGDLKEWLEALVTLGKFTDSTYVNVGNAG